MEATAVHLGPSLSYCVFSVGTGSISTVFFGIWFVLFLVWVGTGLFGSLQFVCFCRIFRFSLLTLYRDKSLQVLVQRCVSELRSSVLSETDAQINKSYSSDPNI
jgi:hypothetical protein